MYSQFCYETCFEDRRFPNTINISLGNGWGVIGIWACLCTVIGPWQSPREHRKLHPGEPSHMGIQKTDSHTSDTYHLPRFTIGVMSHTRPHLASGDTTSPLMSDPLSSTASPKLTSCSSSDSHFHKQTEGRFQRKVLYLL